MDPLPIEPVKTPYKGFSKWTFLPIIAMVLVLPVLGWAVKQRQLVGSFARTPSAELTSGTEKQLLLNLTRNPQTGEVKIVSSEVVDGYKATEVAPATSNYTLTIQGQEIPVNFAAGSQVSENGMGVSAEPESIGLETAVVRVPYVENPQVEVQTAGQARTALNVVAPAESLTTRQASATTLDRESPSLNGISSGASLMAGVTQTPGSASLSNRKVMVINFDPIIESRNNQRLTQVKGWTNPTTLEASYIAELKAIKNTDYQIVERIDADQFPVKASGFRFTDDDYLNCMTNNTCNSEIINYNAVLSQYGVCDKLNNRQIDELWIWGGPWFGYYEATMTGPGAFHTNGVPFGDNNCNRQLNIMGFNYERGVTEMMHSMGHRVEGTIRQIHGGVWNYGYYQFPSSRPNNLSNWDKMTARGFDVGINPGCGNVHGGLNSDNQQSSAYDYGNTRTVNTTCFSWPAETTMSVNCTAWGCNHLGFLRMWLARIPADWWGKVLDYNNPIPFAPFPPPVPLVNHAPTVATAIGPVCSVAGQTVNISATYTDQDGATDLQFLYLQLASTANPANIFTTVMYGQTGKILVRKADGSAWLPDNTYDNGLGIVDAVATTKTVSGNNITVRWSLKLSNTWGPVSSNISLKAHDVAGVSSEYQRAGTHGPCATPTPATFSWTVNVQAVCGTVPVTNRSTTLITAIWPPNPLTFTPGETRTGTHTKVMRSTDAANSVYIELLGDNTPLQPVRTSPTHSGFTLGKFFNPQTWMIRWDRTVPSGTYTLDFQAPASWCTVTPTTAPTATPTPTTNIRQVNVRPTIPVVPPTPTPVVTNAAPQITTGVVLPIAGLGRRYATTVLATDQNAADNLTMTVTNLPAGLSAICARSVRGTTNCQISGIATKRGVFTISSSVTDGRVTIRKTHYIAVF